MAGGVLGVPGDYAINIGTTGADYDVQSILGTIHPNGPFRPIRGIPLRQIYDGTSNTLMVGEKHVPMEHMAEFPWDCSIFDGHNPVCNTRCAGPGFPLANNKFDLGWKFGSYHSGICQFVFCDGSVRSLRNSVNEVTLGLLANIHDGLPIPEY
jgi:prepilin-type processing-associated H-X9-DG protein